MQQTNTIQELFSFLFEENETIARRLANEFEEVGLPTPMKFGSISSVTKSESVVDVARKKNIVLIMLGRSALERAVKGFEKIRVTIEARIRRARWLRLVSAITTTTLSSSVVASLGLAPNSTWGFALGVLAAVSSILTIAATFIEGGDLKLAEEFAQVAAKHAEANSLLERLTAYAQEPEIFDDVPDRLQEAERLVKFLQDAILRWPAPR